MLPVYAAASIKHLSDSCYLAVTSLIPKTFLNSKTRQHLLTKPHNPAKKIAQIQIVVQIRELKY